MLSCGGRRRQPPASCPAPRAWPCSTRPRATPAAGPCWRSAATAASPRSTPAPGAAPGAVRALRDVFADPAEGGQAPYRIYQRALKSGAFTEVRGDGSLRLLERTGDGIG